MFSRVVSTLGKSSPESRK